MKSNIEFYPKIFKKPNIEINLIGYNEQGESIVIFVRDEINGKVIFFLCGRLLWNRKI